MTDNIEGFKEHYEIIESKPFYKKYEGKISINNKVLVIAETQKAILIREKNQIDKEVYGLTTIWISKTLIIKREMYYPKYKDAYDSYIRITKELGGTIDFTYEQYLELVLKNK